MVISIRKPRDLGVQTLAIGLSRQKNWWQGTIGSGYLRQMSEYPIPPPQRAISFLHPEEMEACIPES
jgi:hypothetical protein